MRFFAKLKIGVRESVFGRRKAFFGAGEGRFQRTDGCVPMRREDCREESGREGEKRQTCAVSTAAGRKARIIASAHTKVSAPARNLWVSVLCFMVFSSYINKTMIFGYSIEG